MIHRLREWHEPRRLERSPGEVMLYRGVPYKKAVEDAGLKRLYFSQAISHSESVNNRDSGEVFRTEAEWTQLRRTLGEEGKSDPERSDHFHQKADQFSRSCYYISCLSLSREIAVQKFAYNYVHERPGVMCISQDDLVAAIEKASLFWNRLKDQINPMVDAQGRLSVDYEPEYISYALGKVAYVNPEELTGPMPQRVTRAMRLPKDFEEEDEWRIALDLSLVSSQVSMAGLVQSGLMPVELADSVELFAKSADGRHDGELNQMAAVEFSSNCYLKYEQGLWLNHVDLAGCDSFRLERL